MNQAQKALENLFIGRAEDLPYGSSPPVQFVYESTATLALGAYTWADAPSVLTPQRPILDNALYFFRSISLSADVTDFDFTTNITTRPQFFMFLEGDSRATLFREPIEMNMFYQNFTYRFFWTSHQGQNDILFAAFRGVLIQGPGLVGKSTITLKSVISAQEIIDEQYISLFKAAFPAAVSPVRGE